MTPYERKKYNREWMKKKRLDPEYRLEEKKKNMQYKKNSKYKQLILPGFEYLFEE